MKRTVAFCLSALLCVSPLCAQAQQPAASAAEVENVELRRRVRELEERLQRAEALLKPGRDAGALDAGATSVQRAREPEDEPAASSGGPRQEQPQENELLRFFKSTTVNGYIDTYYAYNFNRPHDALNSLRAFDTRHNQFSLAAVGLAFEKTPDAASRVGYRLDLLFGPAADYLASAEPGGIEVYKHIHQAYGSYLAPVGSGLQLDFGKLISWSGAESDQVLENWNYSRGLLYSFASPTYHMGLRATYSFGPKVTVMGAVVNGWNNVEDNNGGKTVALALTLNPTNKFSLTQNYIFGAEQPGDRRHKRHFFDTIITYDFNDRLAFLGNYDYGFDRLADGSRVRWQGVAAALRYAPAGRFAISPRVEWYADYDGFTTGAAQRLREATLTGEYRVGHGLTARLEYRRDWSDKHVFETAAPSILKRTRATLASGLIWSFDSAERKPPEPEQSPPAAPPATTTSRATASVARIENPAPPPVPQNQDDAALRVIARPAPPPHRTRERRRGAVTDAPAVFTGSLYGFQSPTNRQD
ncbi:MAG TPA: porin [Pyrinomonadaceae bacterium]